MRVDQNFKGCRGAHEVNSKALMQPCLLGNCCLVFDAYLLRHPPVRIKIYEHTQILQQKSSCTRGLATWFFMPFLVGT